MQPRSLLLLVLSVVCMTSAYPATPRLEWQYQTGGKIYSAPIVADLENDGHTEILIAASRAYRLICFNGTGEVRWDFQWQGPESDGLQATPSVIDYNGDGLKEVFVIDSSGVVAALDHTGALIWRAYSGDKVSYSGPVAADLDGDNAIELVFGSESGTVYCLDNAGVERWHFQGLGSIRGIPAIAFDPATSTMRTYVTFGGGELACLSSEGNVLWRQNEVSPRGQRWSGPAVGDLDGDGTPEVVTASESGAIIAVDAFTGAERWRWQAPAGIDQTHSFALVDVDQSGRLDVIGGDGTGLGGPGHLFRLRDGQPLWVADLGGGLVQGPSVADVDGDGAFEILAGARNNCLVCYSDAGVKEWEWPTEAGALSTPALGDVDDDGQIEIVFTCKDGYVRCLTLGAPFNPQAAPWPCMNHDPQLSGNVAGAPFSKTRPSSSESPQPPCLELSDFDPLFTGENTLCVRFGNPTNQTRLLELSVEITRAKADKVTHVSSVTLPPGGRDEAQIQFDAIYSGIYDITTRLVDAGTGAIMQEDERHTVLYPLLTEKLRIQNALCAADKALSSLKDTDLINRAQIALNAIRSEADNLPDIDEGVKGEVILEQAHRAMAIVMKSYRIASRLCAASMTPGSASAFAVVNTTSLATVFKDEPFVTGDFAPTPCQIELAGNEYEGVQIVVVPLWMDLNNLRVTATDLIQTNGTSQIASANITINRVGYIEMGAPEYAWNVDKRGEYPDVMFPDDPVNIKANQNAQPWFVTVYAPKDTPPGDYTGTIQIQAEGTSTVSMPLTVHVWGFSLSDETHLKTSFWMSEGDLQRFYKYEGRTPFEVRKRYYDYHLQHRAGPLMAIPAADSDLIEDFDYVMAHGQNNLFVHVPPYVPAAEREPHAASLRAIHDLVKSKGWNEKTQFYSRDEVAVMARHEIPQVVEMNAWAKSIIPDWPRLETSAAEQALFGAVDVWCPLIDVLDPVIWAQRQEKGEHLWMYTVWGRPGVMIEGPGTDARMMFWMCWHYNAEGFLYWGTTHWDLNMRTDQRWPEIPWIPYNAQPGHNGCGYLIYPGPNGTPLGSIRFERIRDGIEDYEYFYALRTIYEQNAEKLPEDLQTRAKAALAIPREVLTDNKTFTSDPIILLNTRKTLATTLEDITKALKN